MPAAPPRVSAAGFQSCYLPAGPETRNAWSSPNGYHGVTRQQSIKFQIILIFHLETTYSCFLSVELNMRVRFSMIFYEFFLGSRCISW